MNKGLSDKAMSGSVIAGPLGYLILVAASWAFLLAGAGLGMSSMSTFRFPPPMPADVTIDAWTSGYALTILVMWWVMMIAMMLPALAGRKSGLFPAPPNAVRPVAPRPISMRFCLGYALAWLVFSLFATMLHHGLEQNGLVHGRMMWSLSPHLSIGLLVCAGLYQLSALKRKAARNCHRIDATRQSLRAGLTDGLACTASSGPLMLLLFVGGVMNLVWIVALTAVNLLEKRLPNPQPLSLAVGVGCLSGAVWIFSGTHGVETL